MITAAKRRAALVALSLEGEPDEQAIRAAFGAAIRGCHPDTGGKLCNAASELRRFKAARDLLLCECSDEITTCKTCQGVGIVRGVQCPGCSGRGAR